MNYHKLKLLLLKPFNIPKSRAIHKAIRSFTLAEKAVFYFFATAFVLSSLTLLSRVSASFMVEIPTSGGSVSEGVVGNPRFINPVLAISEADKSLSALVYSGLVSMAPTGEVQNNLAESVFISDDGLTYTVRISPDAVFHDGALVTADDVVFTIQKIADPLIKSPRRGNWDGVTVEKVDDRTVAFHLSKPYGPFFENLTLGILPKHIWKNVTDEEFAFSQFNSFPIGSGPFVVSRVERNQGGIPNFYELTPFDDALGGKPYVNKMVFRFYPNEDALFEALEKGDIESVAGLSPAKASLLDDERVVASPLPRVFAVFFNQSHSKVLLDDSVREALDLASPKESIVQNVLGGYATAIDGPLPPGLFEWSGKRASEESYEERFERAKEILSESGWELNPQTGTLEKKSGQSIMELSFSISTGDAPELRAVANELVNAWRQLGARVEIQVFETGDLNQNVIRPREFDALLFGTVVGRDADVYPFWHSSQRNDPGLNISLYANADVDKLLETARAASDPADREEAYMAFDEVLREDAPAVFLYSPSFLYVMPEKVNSVTLGGLSTSQDRYLSVRDWYIETDKIWEIFNR